MLSRLRLLAAGLLVLGGMGLADAADIRGARDPAGFNKRYPGAEIVRYQQRAFDLLSLLTGPVTYENQKAPPAIVVEGALTEISYAVPPGPSMLEVAKNYELALADAGFETLWSCEREDCGGALGYLGFYTDRLYASGNIKGFAASANAISQDWAYRAVKKSLPTGQEIHLGIYVTSGGYPGTEQGIYVQLDQIESRPMAVGMEVVSADKMAGAIGDTGRIALYGIFFDFDKAAVKPESGPTLAEIVKLLKAEPALKLYVVGHTDGKGAQDYNQPLSQRRAAAVVDALVKQGIDKSRLAPAGVGMLAPVTSNETEEGRARNRRVELVKR